MKFKVIVRLIGLTDKQGNQVKAEFIVEAASEKGAVLKGKRLWKLSNPTVEAFPIEEEPDLQ